MNERAKIAALELGILATLAGCGSGGGRDLGSGPAPSPAERSQSFPRNYDDYARLGYIPDWVGYPEVTGHLPVVFVQPYPDFIATLEAGSTVTILEGGTGSRRCADQLASPLTRFVGLARDPSRLYACSESEVFVLDPQTCNLVGRQKIEKIVRTEPVLYGNLLIFGTGTGELLAHITTTNIGGIKAWGFGTSGVLERRPALIGTAVGAVSQSGEVVFVDAASGSLLGQTRIYGGLDCDPVADEHTMYIASLDQSVYAFAPENARLLWRYRTATPLRTQPTAAAGRLYVGIPGEGLKCFEGATGKILWTCKDFAGTVVASNKGKLLAWDGKAAAVIDPDRGDLLDRVPLPGVQKMVPEKFDGGNLYILSTSGLVGKFKAK